MRGGEHIRDEERGGEKGSGEEGSGGERESSVCERRVWEGKGEERREVDVRGEEREGTEGEERRGGFNYIRQTGAHEQDCTVGYCFLCRTYFVVSMCAHRLIPWSLES